MPLIPIYSQTYAVELAKTLIILDPSGEYILKYFKKTFHTLEKKFEISYEDPFTSLLALYLHMADYSIASKDVALESVLRKVFVLFRPKLKQVGEFTLNSYLEDYLEEGLISSANPQLLGFDDPYGDLLERWTTALDNLDRRWSFSTTETSTLESLDPIEMIAQRLVPSARPGRALVRFFRTMSFRNEIASAKKLPESSEEGIESIAKFYEISGQTIRADQLNAIEKAIRNMSFTDRTVFVDRLRTLNRNRGNDLKIAAAIETLEKEFP